MSADVIVRGGPAYTLVPDQPWAEALAVRDGRILAVGREIDVLALRGPRTQMVDAAGGMVLPGLVDVHAHLGFGGQAVAWELNLPPTLDVADVLAAVRGRAEQLGPDEWVVGGVVRSAIFHAAASPEMLAALDEASLGRPVLLRDDSLHNRWVNSRALRILGIDTATPDPVGGSYSRDGRGQPVGVLLGQPSTTAELAAHESVRDPRARDLHSARTAVSIFNSLGVTAIQDAATMGSWLDVFTELDRAEQLNVWIIASMPAREFVESGPVGTALFDTAAARQSAHVRPDFVKGLLDGVPMTRTSKFLSPYKPDPFPQAGQVSACPFQGEGLFTDAELHQLLDDAITRGLHVKLHATADATVRQVLDAVAIMRERYGSGPVFHIAHPEFVDPDDLLRFSELDVVADVSPGLWYPNPMNDIIAAQVDDHYMTTIWPLRALHGSGALVAAGSDWPVGTAVPNPWLSIETMVTRRNPDPAFPGTLAGDQALDLPTALAAHTTNPARAMGLHDQIGRLEPGLSADFIVLDSNLFDGKVEQIHETQVHQTWFGGRLVHDASDTGPALSGSVRRSG
jgi:hypothetical protein